MADLDLDSRGGEFGRAKGLTLNEIQAQFTRLASEPSARSFSAVLRIVREQIDSRGHLEVYTTLLVVATLLAPFFVVAWMTAVPALKEVFGQAAIGSGVMVALMLGTNIIHRHSIAEARAHKRFIRREGIAALLKLADAEGWEPKPLTLEQRQTLKDLFKSVPSEDFARFAAWIAKVSESPPDA